MAWYCKKCNHEMMKIIYEEGIGIFPFKKLDKEYKFQNVRYKDIYTCSNRNCKVTSSHNITEISYWIENNID